jgi:hypothetical protein
MLRTASWLLKQCFSGQTDLKGGNTSGRILTNAIFHSNNLECVPRSSPSFQYFYPNQFRIATFRLLSKRYRVTNLYIEIRLRIGLPT